jgi:hypothetical protein
MAGIPDRYENTFRRLQQLTAQLHQMIETGEFYSLSLSARRKMLRHVKRLYNRLVGSVAPRVLVSTLAAGVLLLAGCFQPTVPDLEGDPDPEPEPEPEPSQEFVPNFSTVAQPNPYGIGLSSGNLYASIPPVFVDLDADGDLDLVYPFTDYAESYNGIQKHQNGTTSFDPYALLDVPRSEYITYENRTYADLRTFVDIDADSDLDAVLSGFTYYANGVLISYNLDFDDNGILDAATFDRPAVDTPFTALGADHALDVTFADLDADGDQDMLYLRDPSGEPAFSLNYGTAAASDFLAPVDSPYTDLTLADYEFHSIEAVDIDNDGDVDILVGTYFYYDGSGEARLLFYENTGSAEAPAFGPRVVNPFGLTVPGTYA